MELSFIQSTYLKKVSKNGTPGTFLTKEFFDLSLKKKWEVWAILYENGILHDVYNTSEKSLDNKIILAILQHSRPKLKQNFPVKGDREISKVAKEADRVESVESINETAI